MCCELKPDHIFLIGNSGAVDEIAAEIAMRNNESASAGHGDLVTASHQTVPRATLGETGSALRGEVIGVLPYGSKIVKTYLDHELFELCDLLKRF